MRRGSTLTYLHGDHLGSASLATNASGAKVSLQRYLPYGGLRVGGSPTDRQYTVQRREATLGFYDYVARQYDPALGRFLQADSIIPGAASGAGGGAATLGYDARTRLTPLTVNLGEFVLQINAESREILQFGAFFQWSVRTRQEHNIPMGPLNPQALNRYAYVLNNPLRYVDPTGHWGITISTHLSASQVQELIEYLDAISELNKWSAVGGSGVTGISGILEATRTTLISGASIELIFGISLPVIALPAGAATGISALSTLNTTLTFDDLQRLRNTLSDFDMNDPISGGGMLQLDMMGPLNKISVFAYNGHKESWFLQSVGLIGSMAWAPLAGGMLGNNIRNPFPLRNRLYLPVYLAE